MITAVGCGTPHVSDPVHSSGLAKYAAMKAAPVVLVAEYERMDLSPVRRTVEITPGVNAPLNLARIEAKVLLTLRGTVRNKDKVEFHSWLWNAGKHGGQRLFRPRPGAVSVVFLREEGGLLRTAGDYPAHDVELDRTHVEALVAEWERSPPGEQKALERVASVYIRSTLEGMTRAWHGRTPELFDFARLTSPAFVAHELSVICRAATNPFAQRAACEIADREFAAR